MTRIWIYLTNTSKVDINTSFMTVLNAFFGKLKLKTLFNPLNFFIKLHQEKRSLKKIKNLTIV